MLNTSRSDIDPNRPTSTFNARPIPMGEPIVELIGSLILLSFFNVPEAWLGIIRANVPVDVVIPVFSAEFESYLPMINTYLGLAVVLASVMLYYRYRVAGILIAELALALFGIQIAIDLLRAGPLMTFAADIAATAQWTEILDLINLMIKIGIGLGIFGAVVDIITKVRDLIVSMR
ncbi:MAG: hypothetical protein R2873_06550 [Caldilineaceae bacterium]|nr:hypothetical protein [Caldilineaceae bacterium]